MESTRCVDIIRRLEAELEKYRIEDPDGYARARSWSLERRGGADTALEGVYKKYGAKYATMRTAIFDVAAESTLVYYVGLDLYAIYDRDTYGVVAGEVSSAGIARFGRGVRFAIVGADDGEYCTELIDIFAILGEVMEWTSAREHLRGRLGEIPSILRFYGRVVRDVEWVTREPPGEFETRHDYYARYTRSGGRLSRDELARILRDRGYRKSKCKFTYWIRWHVD